MRVHADRAALTTRGRFAANIDDFAHLRPFSEAGDPGIEPEAAVLETAVLPLHQSPWPFAPVARIRSGAGSDQIGRAHV